MHRLLRSGKLRDCKTDQLSGDIIMKVNDKQCSNRFIAATLCNTPPKMRVSKFSVATRSARLSFNGKRSPHWARSARNFTLYRGSPHAYSTEIRTSMHKVEEIAICAGGILTNRHGSNNTPKHESSYARRFPLPFAGEGANESLRDFHGKHTVITRIQPPIKKLESLQPALLERPAHAAALAVTAKQASAQPYAQQMIALTRQDWIAQGAYKPKLKKEPQLRTALPSNPSPAEQLERLSEWARSMVGWRVIATGLMA